MSKTLKSIFLFTALFLFFIAGALWANRNLEKPLKFFTDVIVLIQTDYVEEMPAPKLIEGALKGMLKSLDPYSQYLDPQSYMDLQSETSGKFAGLGLEVSIKGGVLHVISPVDGSPAERAGVKPGDVIIKIDDVVTRDMALSDAVHRMRGEPGTRAKLTLMREGENQLLDIGVVRDVVKVKSIREARLLEDNVGYIRLSAFQERSGEDFEKALQELIAKGMDGLIIDVRNNSGGLLLSAVEVTEHLIPKGKTVVYTKGRNPKKGTTFLSQSNKIYSVGPMVVLVNKGSASGSEILAGALQDHALAKIVGSRTFGKGSIQSLVPLAGGAALRLTTSKYYTPKGRVIHEKGIEPDVIVEVKDGSTAADLELDVAKKILQDMKNEAKK